MNLPIIFMLQYTDLDLPSLMDLLVKHTSEYTRMLTYSSHTVEEFAQCKQTLAELQQSIKQKLEQGGYLMNNIIPDFPDYLFSPPDITENVNNNEKKPMQ